MDPAIGVRLPAPQPLYIRPPMPYLILADLVALLHFAFILFVVLGGLAAWKCHRLAWLHVPALLWAALVEFTGWLCPLTPLETSLRIAAGVEAYTTRSG